MSAVIVPSGQRETACELGFGLFGEKPISGTMFTPLAKDCGRPILT
jgi:hypothetical protein